MYNRIIDPFMFIGLGLLVVLIFMLIFSKANYDDNVENDENENNKKKSKPLIIYNDDYDTINTKPCVDAKKQKSALPVINLPSWIFSNSVNEK